MPPSQSAVFLTRTVGPASTALDAPVSARTTASCPPYPRNSDATNQSSALASVGLPNTPSKSFWSEIVTTSPIGPFWKVEANAAVWLDVPTTTALDRSLSLRTTPGEI